MSAARPGDDVALLMPTASSEQRGGAPYTYRLTRREALKGAANRFVHSQAYLWLYTGMALASLVAAFLSFGGASHLDCAHSPDGHVRRNSRAVAFFVLEGSINLILICEVALRLTAFGRGFWASKLNVVDLALVVLCIVTLGLLGIHHACPPEGVAPPPRDAADSEERLDSVLLIFRNVVQALRLIAVVRRSQASAQARKRNTILLGHDPDRPRGSAPAPSRTFHGSGWSLHHMPGLASGSSSYRGPGPYAPHHVGQSREALLGSVQPSPVGTPLENPSHSASPLDTVSLHDPRHEDDEDL